MKLISADTPLAPSESASTSSVSRAAGVRRDRPSSCRRTGSGSARTSASRLPSRLASIPHRHGRLGRTGAQSLRADGPGRTGAATARAAALGRTAASTAVAGPAPTGQVCTGSPRCISSLYRRVVAASAASRSSPPSSARWYVSDLPGRPVHPPPAALLDDAEVEVPVGGLDAPRVQPGRGQRQQFVPYELDGGHLRQPAGPARAAASCSSASMPCRHAASKLAAAASNGSRVHTGPRLLGERADQPVVEGGVGDRRR